MTGICSYPGALYSKVSNQPFTGLYITDSIDAFYNEKLNLLTSIRETYNEDQNGKNRSNYKKEGFEKKQLIKLSDFIDDSSLSFSDNN